MTAPTHPRREESAPDEPHRDHPHPSPISPPSRSAATARGRVGRRLRPRPDAGVQPRAAQGLRRRAPRASAPASSGSTGARPSSGRPARGWCAGSPAVAVAWKTRESGATWVYELAPTATGTSVTGRRVLPRFTARHLAAGARHRGSRRPRRRARRGHPHHPRADQGRPSRPEPPVRADGPSRAARGPWGRHGSLLWANTGGCPVEMSGPPSRVGPVTENSTPGPAAPQMNGGASSYGLDDHIYQRLLRERIVFLGSEVRDQNANAICAQLLLLSAEDPEADIFLHINSPGGSVDAGMAIYDTMNYIPNDVATVGHGPGRLDGPVPALRRRGGQALRPAARADHDAPALRRHGRLGLGHQDPGPAVAAHQEGALRADQPAHRPGARAGRARRRPRPLVHRRARPRTTASSTT